MHKIFELIEKSKKIAIFAHINCDGDAVGSVMSFYNYLKSIDKDVFVFLQRPINDNYYYMGINEVANIKFDSSYDLAISVDCPNTKRFGEFEKEFFKATESIQIDHHIDNEQFATVNCVDSKASSTCEIIYKLFTENEIKIDDSIATCLYSGIITDTRRFINPNVTSNSLFVAGKLIDCGANFDVLNYNLFGRIKKNEFEILKLALNCTEFYEDGKIAFVGITKKMLDKANADSTCTYRIIDQVNSIDGVEICALLTENKYRDNMVSVRTKQKSAQRICKAFGGGGHLRASGCRIFVPFNIAKEQLIEECKKEFFRND